MMITRALFTIVALLLVSPGSAEASEAGIGKPSALLVHEQGAAFFHHDGPRTARPACASEDRWVINLSTQAGQAMYAAVLTAIASGRKIAVHGAGTCSVWGDTESVTYIQVFD